MGPSGNGLVGADERGESPRNQGLSVKGAPVRFQKAVSGLKENAAVKRRKASRPAARGAAAPLPPPGGAPTPAAGARPARGARQPPPPEGTGPPEGRPRGGATRTGAGRRSAPSVKGTCRPRD